MQTDFHIETINKFYQNYIHKLIKNDESLVLLFHVSPFTDAKFNLLNVFKNLLKTVPYDFVVHKNLSNTDSLSVQVG